MGLQDVGILMRLFMRPLLLLLVLGLSVPAVAFAQRTKGKRSSETAEAAPATDPTAMLLYGPTGDDRSGVALEALKGRLASRPFRASRATPLRSSPVGP